jgi:DNA-binding MarR family transcriptional regulator
MGWQRVREDIYRRIQEDGYSDLNPSHVSLFRYEGLDGRRPTQLAESMQITKQSVNDLLRHMEEKGYLECWPDPDDKRAKLIRLTARGRKLDEAIRKHAHEAERMLANELGEEKFHELYGLLAKLSDPPAKQN